MFNVQDFDDWLPVKNVGATEIPPYAALLVDGLDTGKAAVRVKRPTKDDHEPGMVLFNGPVPIGTGAYGFAREAKPTIAYFSGSPSVGDEVGTVQDQYYLSTGKKGFLAWDTVTGTGGTATCYVKAGPKSIVGIVCGTGGSAGTIITTSLSTS